LAGERGLPWFILPADREDVARMIRETAQTSTSRSGRDRRSPTARQTPEGSLIYRDRDGQEWTVYDRRGGDRRSPGVFTAEYRTFVNTNGEEFHYALSAHEAGEISPVALERQLALATRDGA
jgi:hypothetical protein